MTTAQLKQTPLASIHMELGARMVDFAGWNMPVQYKSIVNEHMAVRTKAGLFDVSHMGEFLVSGPQAAAFIQYMVANDISKLDKPNMALYTQMVNEDGGTVDDLIVYRREKDFLLVVNASNIEKDWNWLSYYHRQKFKDLKLENVSEHYSLLALQGPKAEAIMSKVAGDAVKSLPSFHYMESPIKDFRIGFGRTGYTGEDGFEILVENSHAESLWNILMDAGTEFELEPCGLGARDTLRLEAGLPLYGHELDENTSPIEAGLSWSVKLNKGNFIGKDVLNAQTILGPSKVLVCLKSEGKALPRQGYTVYAGDEHVGEVTSGSQGIFIGVPVAFAYVRAKYSKIGQKLQVHIREKAVEAEVVKKPFYKRK